MKNYLIKKLGGYTEQDYDKLRFETELEIDNLEEGFYKERKELKAQIENLESKIPDGREALAEIVKDHFRGVDEKDILRAEKEMVKDNNGRPMQKVVWYHKGKKIDDGTLEMLKRDAQMFYDSRFFEILQDELAYHAQRQMMVNNATDPDHLVSGKMLVYLNDVIKTKLKKFIGVK